ncbi:MAG: hypothetical protein ACRDJ9_35240 [Dehalococcoidia bacterium]
MRRSILYIGQILQWADEHYQRTGRYPRRDSGPVQWAFGEKWMNIDMALRVGLRGLPGGSSLARLLQEHRGVRNRKNLPPYTFKQLDDWADVRVAAAEAHERLGETEASLAALSEIVRSEDLYESLAALNALDFLWQAGRLPLPQAQAAVRELELQEPADRIRTYLLSRE